MAVPDDDANLIKILVTTDNHLGYAEKDPVRANDSFLAFEETLKLAKSEDVDMILLGGDLFHENKPSRKTLHRCIELLRQYCLGSRPCSLEFRSDPTVNFAHSRFPVANYEDPNINVAMPVFSIHGNHDDPVGHGNLCALDLLSAAGLVNYFGKASNLDEITISPVLLQKGTTKLALYGLGAVRDERLHRLFVSRKVNMLRPREETSEWFNMFVVHQNRTKHTSTNYLPEQVLDDFLNLVVWGHEHECLIEPQASVGGRGFFVTQPGSTVVTSLSEGEAKPKYCSLLKIHGKEFKMRHIRLTAIRPFFFETLVLSDVPSLRADDPDHVRLVEAVCKDRIEALIARAEDESPRAGSRQLRLPLIRLRVDHAGGFETFSTVRFGQQFVDRVANPKDLVLFSKRRQASADGKNDGDGDEDAVDFAAIEGGLLDSGAAARALTVEEMVKKYFEQAEDKLRLAVLTENGMGLAVSHFVDKQENDSIRCLVDAQIKSTQSHLQSKDIKSEDDIVLAMDRYREERRHQRPEFDELRALEEAARAAAASERGRRAAEDGDEYDLVHRSGDGDHSGDEWEAPSAVSKASRGAGSRGRGAARGTRRGRAASTAVAADGSSSSNAGRARGRGRARGTGDVEGRGAAKRKSEFCDEVTISDSDEDDGQNVSRHGGGAANVGHRGVPRDGSRRPGRGVAFFPRSDIEPPAKRTR